MASFVLDDFIRETSTTTGTGTYTLLGAVAGFRTFSSAIGNTNICSYIATMGTGWEIGIGTVGAGTISRTTILGSSNADSAVSWGAGTKDVRCDAAAAILTQCYMGAIRWAGTMLGTGGKLSGTVTPPIHEYWAGLTIHCITGVALSTSPSPTINFNGVGEVPLRELDASSIPINEIGSNELMTVVNDGTIFRITRTLAF